ncbi:MULTISPECIES: helix-turn-helix domain-containing protein [Brevibacterium]|uniref:Helix-turn-helix transcriptional regulator n=1 Tax=Brevibacterium casei TaxID=33889 RepID=A0A7T4A0G8_9MICO|nr:MULTISPECIES: helix-turn-helix domain-containing protein [Brevibacterium]QQB15041.1 helix-turn-helix transcriptional regulator [Brevibacterium casei]
MADVLGTDLCTSTDRAWRVLGKRWSGLIIDLLLQGPARFSELERGVEGLSNKVLGERLRELEALGLVERQVDTGPPITVTYALTPRGLRLRPAFDALRTWAQEMDADPDEP